MIGNRKESRYNTGIGRHYKNNKNRIITVNQEWNKDLRRDIISLLLVLLLTLKVIYHLSYFYVISKSFRHYSYYKEYFLYHESIS